MPETTYDKIRKQECERCRMCVELRLVLRWIDGEMRNVAAHMNPQTGKPDWDKFPCTAPTKDAVIDRLTSALERARKAIDDAPHDEDCAYIGSLLRFDGTGKRIPVKDCTCWHDRALAALDSKEQVKNETGI